MRRALMSLVGWLVLSVCARPALACAVCFQAKESNRWAFIFSTVFLTFLPLFFVGGVAWWVRRRVRSLVHPCDTGSGGAFAATGLLASTPSARSDDVATHV